MSGTVETVMHGPVAVVTVAGDIDVYSAATLRAELADAIETTDRDLVVDLTAAGYVDSTCVGVLVGARKKAFGSGVRLRLVLTGKQAIKVFRVKELLDIFTVHETLDDALAA